MLPEPLTPAACGLMHYQNHVVDLIRFGSGYGPDKVLLVAVRVRQWGGLIVYHVNRLDAELVKRFDFSRLVDRIVDTIMCGVVPHSHRLPCRVAGIEQPIAISPIGGIIVVIERLKAISQVW